MAIAAGTVLLQDDGSVTLDESGRVLVSDGDSDCDCCDGEGPGYYRGTPCAGGRTVYIRASDAPDASKIYLLAGHCYRFRDPAFSASTPPTPLMSLAAAAVFNDCAPCENNTSPCLTCISPTFIILASSASHSLSSAWVLDSGDGLAYATTSLPKNLFFPVFPACPTGPFDANPRRLRREGDGRWYFRFDGVGGLVEAGTISSSFAEPPLGEGQEGNWLITANTTGTDYQIVEAGCCDTPTDCADLPQVIAITLPDGSPIWDSLIPNPASLYPDTDYPVWDGTYHAVDGDPCNGYLSWLDGDFKRVQVSGGYILSAAFSAELVIENQWGLSVHGACESLPLGLLYLGTNISPAFLGVPPVVRIG